MTLKNQRGAQSAIINKVNTFISEFDTSKHAPALAQIELKSRLTTMRNARTEYIRIYKEILNEETDPDKVVQDLQLKDEFIDKCADIEIKISELVTAYGMDNPNDSANNFSHALLEKITVAMETLAMNKVSSSKSTVKLDSPHIRLPKHEIPSFSGDYADWIHFKDLFIASVHNHPHISDVEKLSYLKSSLRGEAANEIKHLAITNGNYEIAWNAIQKRYDDKPPIINEYIRIFLTQPTITKPNADNIRQLLSTSNSAVNALDSLEATSRDPWLLHLILQKLDDETRILWARESHDQPMPTWIQFIDFLTVRCRTLERGQSAPSKPSSTSISSQQSTSSKFNYKNDYSKRQSSTFVTTELQSCKNCSSGNHPLYKCEKFLSMSPESRFAHIRQMNLCRNCINSNHMTSSCKFSSCRKCNSKHNTLLHDYFAKSNTQTAFNADISSPAHQTHNLNSASSAHVVNSANATNRPVNPSNVIMTTTNATINGDSLVQTRNSSNNLVSSVSCISSASPKIFLATALIKIRDGNKSWQLCRAVLDCASQVNLMTTNLCNRLGLKKFQSQMSLAGVTNQINEIKHATSTVIQSRLNNEWYDVNCLVVPKITGNLPNWNVNVQNIPIPPQLQLADPQWHIESPVDILIGGQYYWNILLNDSNTIKIGNGCPILKNTSFGWIIVGEHDETITMKPPVTNLCCNLTTFSQLDCQLRKFWEIEDASVERIETLEHQEVEQHFTDTFKRDSEGRFVVALPFRDDHVKLGDSRQRALRSYHSLENRLDRNPDLRHQYNLQLLDYLSKGYMEEARYDPTEPNLYLPHHGVVRENSATTKLRIVFNGSAATSSGLSLNSVLKSAQTVQPELITILHRFRLYRFAMSCDITKMYLQLRLFSPHANFQRIVWRQNRDEPIKDYKITRVCFGVKSSPFLATRALNQLAYNEQINLPLASSVVLNNFYVDDGLISCETLDQALSTQTELIKLMQLGGFSLSKWSANNLTLLRNVQSNVLSHEPIAISEQPIKTLGLCWNGVTDTFQYSVPTNFEIRPYSKREIISIISGLFDPAGWVGCVLTEAKLIMQETWKVKLNWADLLPHALQIRWEKFILTLPQLNDIRIPRWISTIDHPNSYELHGFSDASSLAYGCTIYIVTRSLDGCVSSNLILAKSRIAPIAPSSTTIPRLELCGAEICARQMNRLKHDLNIADCYFWCDSEIVLHWIHSSTIKWNIFINNRIKFIQEVSDCHQWRHVISSENPADMISRGCTPETLINSYFWFHGPQWLITADKNNWPKPFHHAEPVTIVALPTQPNYLQEFYSNQIEQKSLLPKIQKIIGWCLRFISNCHLDRKQRKFGPLTASELKNALSTAIGLDQRLHFQDVIVSLTNNTYSKQLKSMSSLKPFLDGNGMIRVTGRLSNSAETYDTKHPLILPRSHLTTVIARHFHETNLHAGSQLLLATLRQQFWPVGGRNLTRQISRKCVRCFKVNPRFMPKLMGNLLEPRVTGQAALTYEEFNTVLSQIEAVLNSRPLTPLSADSNDPPHLTPGHFLIGRPLNALPDPNLSAIPITRLKRWQLCQHMTQDFAKRWKLEYLTNLQKRNKWTEPTPNFKPGDIVLLQDDNQPSIKWPLGTVVHIYPGKDKKVRVVDVRTQHGIFRRSTVKIAKLPLELPPPQDVDNPINN